MRVLPYEVVLGCFERLPPDRRIATLSPGYTVLDAARDDALTPQFVGEDSPDGFWFHGVHRSAIPGTELCDFQSPYGYGGPVSNITAPDRLAEIAQDYDQWCRDNGVLAEFVRLHPMALEGTPYHGTEKFDRECVVVDLANPDIRAGYETRARTAVRKAEKSGVTVIDGRKDDIAGRFAEFYREGMRMIGASDFYFFPDRYFEALGQFGPIKLLVAELDGEWAAASLFFTSGDVWEYHLSAATPQGRKACAANLLLDHAAAMARMQGARKLFLGGGTDCRPDNPLLFFKAGFGSARVPFRIGFQVHMPGRYTEMRERRRDQAENHRILFYRS